MTGYKVQDLSALEDEMRAVARGERVPPADAAAPSFESVEALARLLTPENRRLLALIRDCRPQSVTALADLAGRAEPNLLRTLEKLRAAGLIRLEQHGRCKVPVTVIGRIVVEIDPYSTNDRVRAEPV
jgi:predicted transcriptional regulator